MGKIEKEGKIIHKGHKKHRVLQWFYLNLIIIVLFTTEYKVHFSHLFAFNEKGFIQLSKC